LGIGAEGEYLPTEHGFDSYFGMPVTNVQTCGGRHIWDTVDPMSGVRTHVWLPAWLLGRFAWLWGTLAAVVLFARVWTRSHTPAIPLLLLSLALFAVLFAYTTSFTLLSPQACVLYRNRTLVEQPVRLENLTRRHTHEALRFLRQTTRQQPDRPFLLFLSYTKVCSLLIPSLWNSFLELSFSSLCNLSSRTLSFGSRS
jgi:steryl-sulfatase